MSNAYSFPQERGPGVWEIVNTRTGKKIMGDVLRSHHDTKFTAWLLESHHTERPIVANTLDELSVKLDAYFNKMDYGFPRRARLRSEFTTCGELSCGDWVRLKRHSLFSSGWEVSAREVLNIKTRPLQEVTITFALPDNPFERVHRNRDEVCMVLYVDQDFVEPDYLDFG